MGDADEFVLLAERYEDLLVLKSDRARGLEARRGEAHEFSKKMRPSASLLRFGMNLRLRLAAPVWYHDTTQDHQSIEALQG